MATYRALAGVSTTLRSLLIDRMENPVPVTIAPPDITVSGVTGSRVNLYLYHVAENGYLKNQEIPGTGHPSSLGEPPLSIDLQYLLTSFGSSATGADSDLEAQQILGDAMRVLHDFPVVTEALHVNDDPADPPILDVSLLGEHEKLKITLDPAGIERFTGLWSGLPDGNFRRSVSYTCSVVQIESQRARRSALPVRVRQLHAVPLDTPHIDEIVRDPLFDTVRNAVVEVGDTMVIRGRNLRREPTRVTIGSEQIPIPAPRATRIELTVPSTLEVGVHAVQVVQDLLLEQEPGQPPVPHRGFESNAVPMLVIPRWVSVAPPSASAGSVVTVTVDPPVGALQDKVLFLGDAQIPAEAVAHDAAPSTTVDFRLPTGAAALAADTYIARIRVDGAESRMTVDATGAYDGPTVTVT
ncbi:MAG: DUF4255 domain-containing protein [Gemmatimonadota bacterium]